MSNNKLEDVVVNVDELIELGLNKYLENSKNNIIESSQKIVDLLHVLEADEGFNLTDEEYLNIAKEIAELLDKATSIGIDVEGNMLFQKGQDLYIIDSLKDVQLIELIKYKDIEADSRVFILDFENTIRWKMATCDTTLKEGIFRQVKDDLYVVVDADSISIPIRVGSFTKGELTKDRTYDHKWLHQILLVFKRNMVLNFGKTIYEPLVIDHKNWTVAMMGYRG